MRKPLTVGEIIASHHSEDAFFRARENEKKFTETPIGSAFRRWENAHARLWQLDSNENVSHRSLEAATAKEKEERSVFMTLLKDLMRKASIL